MKGGDFLGAGEFTVKVKDVEFNDKEGRYFTIVFENNEGKTIQTQSICTTIPTRFPRKTIH